MASLLGYEIADKPTHDRDLGVSSNDPPLTDAKDFLLSETNRCVSCGLCLPHCPTYRLTQSEADSPRGRIAMMSGVASRRIPLNSRFIEHMDRCLTCRACETVCPNNVAYGALIDEARAMIATSPFNLTAKNKPWSRTILERAFITKPTRFDSLRRYVRFFQRSGLQQWLTKSKLARKTNAAKLVTQLPLVGKPCTAINQKKTLNSWQNTYPAISKQRGEVGLFLGCIARLADVTTLNSTIFVLNHLGYTVHIPGDQTCCGALNQHMGDKATSHALLQQNSVAFNALGLQAIITTASGCGVQLTEYNLVQTRKISTLTPQKHPIKSFSSSIIDINTFLVSADGWDNVKIMPLAAKISVQDPCSLRYGLRSHTDAYTVLARIPDLQIKPLAGNDQCCGAAGTYFLDQPEMATALQTDKISAIISADSRYLATSNIGCSLHIANGLKAAGATVEVLHPVTLLARQIKQCLSQS